MRFDEKTWKDTPLGPACVSSKNDARAESSLEVFTCAHCRFLGTLCSIIFSRYLQGLQPTEARKYPRWLPDHPQPALNYIVLRRLIK